MENISFLPYETEALFQDYVIEQFKKENLSAAFPNKILRDDVFALLEKYCTVVYYPLCEEKNHGFHIKDMPRANGESLQIVYINTAHTIEKQVFTAAHELGHIWEVDKAISERLSEREKYDPETIISRFAAVLLMPEEVFSAALANKFSELKADNDAASTINRFLLFRLITELMNVFCVPLKAVIIRMVELRFIEEDTGIWLLAYPKKDEIVSHIAKEQGFLKLMSSTKTTRIEKLPELLDEASKAGCVPSKKIEFMRKAFNIDSSDALANELQETVTISTEGGRTGT